MENILSNKTKETQNIPILFCINNDYIEQLIVVITSILENNTASDFTFYIFHNEKFKEENNQIIMETTAKTENNYQKYEKLYVSKENGKPIKMEIKDTNQNTIIYIIYNEININKVANEKIYAFRMINAST